MKKVIAGSSRASFAPERWFLLIAIALGVACTLGPFDFSTDGTWVANRVVETEQASLAAVGLEFTGHFIAFYVLGSSAAFVYGASLSNARFGLLLALTLLFCGSLELAQTFQIARHAHILDFLCNSAGVLLGFVGWVYWSPLRNLRFALLELIRGYSVQVQLAVAIFALGLWCVAGMRPLLGALELDWNDSYPLVIANETDGTRPWVGQIKYVGIYEKALTAEEVSMSHGSGSLRRSANLLSEMGLLVGYDFRGAVSNMVIPGGRLRASDLCLEISSTSRFTNDIDRMSVGDEAYGVTAGPARGLTHAIQSSGEFSIETWIRPAREQQRGPARIVSLSDGVWQRNFMLGQEGAAAVFRVRNGINGPNGHRYALFAGSVLHNSRQQLVATYDHGVSSLFLDGRPAGAVVDLREPPPYLMLGTSHGGRLMGAMLLTLLLAVPLGSLLGGMGFAAMRYGLSAVFTFLVGGLPYVVVCCSIGGPWRLALLICLALALLIAYPACVLYTRVPYGGGPR